MSAPSKLQQAVEQVYRAFSREKPPTALARPSKRNVPRLQVPIPAKPLRDIADEEIGPYWSVAIHRPGSETGYLYYLPRIAELATSTAMWIGAEPQVIADKLRDVGRDGWSEDQREAVAALFQEGFLHALSVHPDQGRAAAGWLYSVAAVGVEVAPFLARWRSSPCANAVLHLADFVRFNAKQVRYLDYDLKGYWQALSRAQRHQIATWLLEQSTHARLDRALQEVAATETWRVEAALADLG